MSADKLIVQVLEEADGPLLGTEVVAAAVKHFSKKEYQNLTAQGVRSRLWQMADEGTLALGRDWRFAPRKKDASSSPSSLA